VWVWRDHHPDLHLEGARHNPRLTPLPLCPRRARLSPSSCSTTPRSAAPFSASSYSRHCATATERWSTSSAPRSLASSTPTRLSCTPRPPTVPGRVTSRVTRPRSTAASSALARRYPLHCPPRGLMTHAPASCCLPPQPPQPPQPQLPPPPLPPPLRLPLRLPLPRPPPPRLSHPPCPRRRGQCPGPLRRRP